MIDLVKTHLTHPWKPLAALGDPWRPLATCLKMINFPPNGHFQAYRKRSKCITGTGFSVPNHHGGPQQWPRLIKVSARSSPSLPVRTRRTKTGWPPSLLSCSPRSNGTINIVSLKMTTFYPVLVQGSRWLMGKFVCQFRRRLANYGLTRKPCNSYWKRQVASILCMFRLWLAVNFSPH